MRDMFQLTWWEKLWYPVRRFLLEVPYWIKSHTYRQWHMIDIRSKHDVHRYSYGWIDADNRMLLACMKIFCHYVEEELDPKHDTMGRISLRKYMQEPGVDEYGSDISPWNEYYKEVEEIYNWWVVNRPGKAALMQKESEGFDITWSTNADGTFNLDTTESVPGSKERLRELRDQLESDEAAMLLRLMAVRKGMWT